MARGKGGARTNANTRPLCSSAHVRFFCQEARAERRGQGTPAREAGRHACRGQRAPWANAREERRRSNEATNDPSARHVRIKRRAETQHRHHHTRPNAIEGRKRRGHGGHSRAPQARWRRSGSGGKGRGWADTRKRTTRETQLLQLVGERVAVDIKARGADEHKDDAGDERLKVARACAARTAQVRRRRPLRRVDWPCVCVCV